MALPSSKKNTGTRYKKENESVLIIDSIIFAFLIAGAGNIFVSGKLKDILN